MMVDQTPSFEIFSARYSNLKQNIDNTLLNIRVRIGDVSAVLPEDTLSKFIIEKVHCSDESQEEVSCVICHEEYMNGDKIGRMKKCEHDYHVDCIKKWLLKKKLCPICRTECST